MTNLFGDEDDIFLDDFDADDVIFDEELEDNLDEELEDNSWDEYDFDFEKDFRDFIDQKEEFIKKFDGLRKGKAIANTGAKQATQDLIEQYHKILDNLKKDKENVIELFSLGELNKSMARHKAYPTAISNHHTRKALAWCLGIGGAVATAGIFYIGGTNPVAWTPTLIWTSAGIATALGASVAIPTRIRNWKKFDRNKVEDKKLNWIEKRIMKKVIEKEYAFSNVSMEIGENILDVLKGNYSIYETNKITRKRFFIFGKERDYYVTDLKDAYKMMPRRKRKKLIKTISEFKELNLKTSMLEEKLAAAHERKLAAERQRMAQQTQVNKVDSNIEPMQQETLVTPTPKPAPTIKKVHVVSDPKTIDRSKVRKVTLVSNPNAESTGNKEQLVAVVKKRTHRTSSPRTNSHRVASRNSQRPKNGGKR